MLTDEDQIMRRKIHPIATFFHHDHILTRLWSKPDFSG